MMEKRIWELIFSGLFSIIKYSKEGKKVCGREKKKGT